MSLRSTPIHPVSLISARIDREITPGESRFLDAHLESCSSCQQKEAELDAICARLERCPVPGPEATEIERLVGQLRKLGPPPKPDTVPEELPAPPRRRRLSTLIVPAVLALFLAGALIGLTRRPDPPAAVEVPAPVWSHPVSMTETDPETEPATCTVRSEPAIDSSAADPERSLPPSAPPPRRAVSKAPAAMPDAVRDVPPLPEPLPEEIATAAEAGSTAEGEAESRSESASSDGTEFATASVFFKGNGKRLNEEARRILASTAEWMQSSDDVRLVIAARTAPRKSPKKTLELGRKRALVVARYLEKQGVAPFRLSPQSHENAIASDDAGGSRSDRVDLVPVR